MTPLWSPTERQIRESHLYRFRERLRTAHEIPGDSFSALHHWSVSRLEEFWEAAWIDATGQVPSGPVLADDAMPPAQRLAAKSGSPAPASTLPDNSCGTVTTAWPSSRKTSSGNAAR